MGYRVEKDFLGEKQVPDDACTIRRDVLDETSEDLR